MRVACVLITHLRAKAEMRRNGEERAERREERENGKGEGRGERREEREKSFDCSVSESVAPDAGSQEVLDQTCATASDARGEGPAAQAVASARQMRSQQPSTLIVERGGVGGGAPVVVDYFPGAAGVKVGMTLEQAVSYLAETVVLNADELYYRQVFGEVIRALQGVSDRVEWGELGTAYVRIDGMEALYGGEEQVVQALLEAVPADLTARIGVADAKFPAFVAARMREPGVSSAPEDVRGFLAPYSVELLPVEADVKGKLQRFGLYRMGEVAAMEEHLIAAQFGKEGGRLWALCHGVDESPVVATAFEESVVEETSLPFNSTSIELLLVAVDTLLRRGYARPELGGRVVGAAALQGRARGWPSWELAVAFKEPVGRWEDAAALIRNRMELEPPQIPVEDVTLTLSDFRGGTGMQMGLFEDVRETAGRRVMEMEKRLQVRMNGNHVLHRIAEVAPWHPAPEMRALQIPIDPAKRDDMRPLHAPARVAVREGSGGEPVEVELGRRWRRVVRVADRWTFDLWWLAQPITRAYYRVGLAGDGSGSDDGQVTLFRDEREGVWYRQNGSF